MRKVLAFILAFVCVVMLFPLTMEAYANNANAGTGETYTVTGSGLSNSTVIAEDVNHVRVAMWQSGSYKLGGRYGFCVQPQTHMTRDTRTGVSWRDYVDPRSGKKLTEDNVKELALGMNAIMSHSEEKISSRYNITMCFVWRHLSEIWGWGIPHTYCAEERIDVLLDEADKASENLELKNIYSCDLTFWPSANGQNLVTYDLVPIENTIIPQNPYVSKTSLIPQITDGNRMYSIEGAVYGMYEDARCTRLLERMTFDKNGNGGRISIPGGVPDGTTYYFREIKAPKGYYLDTSISSITVYADETEYTVSFKDEPASIPLKLLLHKADGDTNRRDSQGDGTLQGAVYGLYYYDVGPENGYGTDLDPFTKGADPVAYWEFETDADGEIWLSEDYVVSGDPLYHDKDGYACLPLGTYVLQELEAPTGYLVSGTQWIFQVLLEDDYPASVNMYWNEPQPIYEDAAKEIPIKGGITAQKWDKELELSEAIGGIEHSYSETGATLEGIEFTIQNASKKYVYVDGREYPPGRDITVLSTKWNDDVHAYIVETGNLYLPYGTYTIRESAANDSYLLTDGEPKIFEIRENGVTVTQTKAGEDIVFKDYVKRQDIEFDKIREFTSEKLSVAFELENLTTGECHVIVTDVNGEIDTSATWNDHTYNTNGNDWLVEEYIEKGERIPTKDLDTKAGVWFGQGEKGHVSLPRNDFGALPYGTYEIRELPCEENDGLTLLSWDFRVERDMPDRPIDLGTNTDRLERPLKGGHPRINTTAMDEFTLSNVGSIKSKVKLIDRVEYFDLDEEETYRLVSTLVDKDTGKPLVNSSGKLFETSCEFVPTGKNGQIDIYFELDSSRLNGHSIVFYEKLYLDEELVTEHSDLRDFGQSIFYPDIKTIARDSEGSKTGVSGMDTEIIDTVRYKNLIPGKKYELRGKLVNKRTGEYLVDNGNHVIESREEFVPGASSGEVAVYFNFDSSELDKDTIVVFEELYYQDTLVVSHNDIDDEDQSIYYEKPVEETPKTPPRTPGVTTGTPIVPQGTPKTGDGSISISTWMALILSAGAILVANKRKLKQ